MAQDEVSLYNLALSVAGARSRISSPDERSRESEICKQWFTAVYTQILRAAPWASVRAFERLALLKERTGDTWVTGDPNPEYRFAYALPSTCLRPRYLYGYGRFEVGLLTTNQQSLMTNVEQALLYYTHNQSQISVWDPDLYLAVAHALGAAICLPLSGKPAMARNALQQANITILNAREAAANESYEPYEATSLSIAVRNSAYNVPSQRFIYPDGPLLGVTNV